VNIDFTRKSKRTFTFSDIFWSSFVNRKTNHAGYYDSSE